MSGYGNYKTIGRLIQFRYYAHTIALCTHNIILRKYIKLINARNVDVDDQGVQLPERYRIGNSGKAVLVAIAIPIFTSQLEKSREATDLANVRSAYAEVMTAALTSDGTVKYNNATIKQDDGSYKATVTLKQQQNDWQTDKSNLEIGGLKESDDNWSGTPSKSGSCVITYKPAAADGTGESFTLAWS